LNGAFPQWMTSEALDNLDDTDHYSEGADFGDNDGDNEQHPAHKYSGLGRNGRAKREEMDATRMGVKEAGWLDDSPNGLAEFDKIPVEPDRKSAAQ